MVCLHSPPSTVPAGILSWRFRNAHQHDISARPRYEPSEVCLLVRIDPPWSRRPDAPTGNGGRWPRTVLGVRAHFGNVVAALAMQQGLRPIIMAVKIGRAASGEGSKQRANEPQIGTRRNRRWAGMTGRTGLSHVASLLCRRPRCQRGRYFVQVW